ncbi:MAG: branched-chain amino acid ABC transporter ATP-binding protein/permease [Pseudomonadota bacterium]
MATSTAHHARGMPGDGTAFTVRLVIACLIVCAVTAALYLGLGRQGERIATQLCVNIAATVALGVFSGNSGIVSFAHAAFMGLGAYLSGILTMAAGLQRSALPMLPDTLAGHELSVWSALVVVALFGGGVAFLIGLPITRLRGASATIATLGILIIVHSVLVGAREITRGSQTFYGVPRTTDIWVALVASLCFIAVAFAFKESRWGLTLRAARDDEPAAIAVGINPRRARLIGWTLSGLLATVAGALYGHMLGAFSPSTFYFGLTFALVAMLIVGGMVTVSGAVAGAIAITLAQDAVRQVEGGFFLGPVEVPAIFGLTTVVVAVLILLVLWRRPEGIVGVRELGSKWSPRRSDAAPSGATHERDLTLPPGGAQLRISNLAKTFGGVRAVVDSSFDAPPGTVTGLIGPNGAGKSTVVNLVTGQYAPSAGSVKFGDEELIGRQPYSLAGLGLARTFQNIRLFGFMTARENVLVAALQQGVSRSEASAIAEGALVRLDLLARADVLASSLAYGERKRLEIARCLALDPSFILLDEPAAGMNPEETKDLADRLLALQRDRQIGMLLIDHDLEFVSRLSSSVVVMNKGEVIAVGPPDAVRADPSVIEAYIGRPRDALSGAEQAPITTTQPFPAAP